MTEARADNKATKTDEAKIRERILEIDPDIEKRPDYFSQGVLTGTISDGELRAVHIVQGKADNPHHSRMWRIADFLLAYRQKNKPSTSADPENPQDEETLL